MQKKKIEQQLIVNPPKTPQQLQFESQWKATEPKPAETKPKPAQPPPPQPSTSKTLVPLPATAAAEEKFDDDDFDDIRFDKPVVQPSFDLSARQSFRSETFSRKSRVVAAVDDTFETDDNMSFNHSLPPRDFNPFGESLPFGDPNEYYEEESSRFVIPGLSYEEETPFDFGDDEDDQEYLPEDETFLSDPPPMPKFNTRPNPLVEIGELLDLPGRKTRPKQ